MKFSIPLFVLSIFFYGCSHTNHFTSPNDINLAVEGETVDIWMIWGNKVHANSFQIKADSAFWVDAKLNYQQSAPVNKIHKISIVDRRKGAWHGFKAFFYTGISVGIFAAFDESFSITPLSDSPENSWGPSFGPAEFIVGGTALGGFYGLIIGAPIGAFMGHRDEYIITEVTQNQDRILKNLDS